VLWLQEDVLQRRHAPKVRKRKKGMPSAAALQLQAEHDAIAKSLADEAKELAKDLEAPLEEALAMLIDDRITPQALGDDEAEASEGALL
jgi:hypothetical protein